MAGSPRQNEVCNGSKADMAIDLCDVSFARVKDIRRPIPADILLPAYESTP